VLPPARIEVESSRIRYVATGIIRYDRDVITYLILIRPALSGIKGLAHGSVCRPGNTAIGAIGVEQLRKKIARIVPCVVPHGVKPSIGRY
jgi:hypothetical protein